MSCVSWAETTHHAVLGLQLNLQGVDGASQLDDLCLAALKLLRAGHHLLVQLLGLQRRREYRAVSGLVSLLYAVAPHHSL